MIESGFLEIYRYVPPAFLKSDMGQMDIDEFVRALAHARYVQEIEEIVMAKAVVRALGGQ